MSKFKQVVISLGFTIFLVLVLAGIVWSQGGNFPPANTSTTGPGTFTTVTATTSVVSPLVNSTVVLTPATAGTHWTDKLVTAYGSAQCASGCTIEIPDSVADDGSATTPSIPSNVAIKFTGSATFTFCNITVSKFTKMYSNGVAVLQMNAGGSGCTGITYTGAGATLQDSDRPIYDGLRINCNSQATSTGMTLTPSSGGSVFDLNRIDVTGCQTVGIQMTGIQFGEFRHLHLQQNYVNLKLYSTAGASSNTFEHLVSASPSSGVGIIVWNSATAQSISGVLFENPQLQNGTIVSLAVLGNATCGTSCTRVAIVGGSPELNGGGAANITIDGNVITKAGALFQSNSVVHWYSPDVEDATATPEFLLNNSSILSLANPAGYGNAAGNITTTDATSTVEVIGHNFMNTSATMMSGTGNFIGTLNATGQQNQGSPGTASAPNWSFASCPTCGISSDGSNTLISAKTGSRDYFVAGGSNIFYMGASGFCDAAGGGSCWNPSTGQISATSLASNTGHNFFLTTAPTIAAAGCGGSAASILASNGTAAFKIGVGISPGSACTVTMPAATTGWNCSASDITTQSTSVSMQRQTGAESTTSVTITNFSDVTVPSAFVASDVLKVICSAD